MPDLLPSKIPLTAWVKCKDPESQIVGGLVLSWEVSWDRRFAAIAAAGVRPDGLPHVELIDYREDTDWVSARLAELVKRHKASAVVVDPGGPAGSLLSEVTERLPVKMDPKPLSIRDMAHACGRIYDAAITGQLRHLGDGRLLEALRKSATRSLADAWAWDRKHSAGDISPLVAVTTALHGLAVHGQPVTPAPAPVVARTGSKANGWSETNFLSSAGF